TGQCRWVQVVGHHERDRDRAQPLDVGPEVALGLGLDLGAGVATSDACLDLGGVGRRLGGTDHALGRLEGSGFTSGDDRDGDCRPRPITLRTIIVTTGCYCIKDCSRLVKKRELSRIRQVCSTCRRPRTVSLPSASMAWVNVAVAISGP